MDELETLKLNEVSQKEKDKYYMVQLQIYLQIYLPCLFITQSLLIFIWMF